MKTENVKFETVGHKCSDVNVDEVVDFSFCA